MFYLMTPSTHFIYGYMTSETERQRQRYRGGGGCGDKKTDVIPVTDDSFTSN